MVINHNVSAINANRMVAKNDIAVGKTMSKLASGMRINQAGDDASGLAVSEKMRAQIGGLRRAEANAQDGISFIQTTEGYLQETTAILQRVRELAVQSANGIYTEEDRMQIQVEVSQLVAEVDRIASHAQFNGLNMLTGRFANSAGGGAPAASMWFHVGANQDQRMQTYIGTMNAAGLGMKNQTTNFALSVSAPEQANQTIGIIDQALMKVNKQRADLGAYQTRLEYVSEGVSIGAENLQASESRIRDTNMAEAASELAKNQILNQAAVSMLAQANTKGQGILRLLG